MNIIKPYEDEFGSILQPITVTPTVAREFFCAALPGVDYLEKMSQNRTWGGHIIRAIGWIAQQEPEGWGIDLVPQFITEHLGLRDYFTDGVPMDYHARLEALRSVGQGALVDDFIGAEGMISAVGVGLDSSFGKKAADVEWLVRYINKGPLLTRQ